MHLTDHISDVLLNEYLDGEAVNPGEIEQHLSACADCSKRFDALRAFFEEIQSLPDVTPSRSLAFPVMGAISQRRPLPRSLTLTVMLQAALAVTVVLLAAPFLAQWLAQYSSRLSFPSLTNTFLQVPQQWAAWLDIFSSFQIPAIPEIPVVELPSLVLLFAVAGVSLLWLVGNGLLLRKKVK